MFSLDLRRNSKSRNQKKETAVLLAILLVERRMVFRSLFRPLKYFTATSINGAKTRISSRGSFNTHPYLNLAV